MSQHVRAACLLSALALVPSLSSAQALVGRNESVYNWRGPLRERALLTVRNVNGPIELRPSNSTSVELRAEKRPSRGAAVTDVAFDVQTSSSGDVTICSTFRDQNPCDRESHRSRDDGDDYGRSISVVMTLLVPRGVQVRLMTGNGAISVERVGVDLQATTGNGRVEISGTDGPVRVSTGNGDVAVHDARASVRVTTGNGRVMVTTSEGPVEARSGNGDIDVRMTALRAREDMSFHTGSGEISVTLPAGYNGELDASTGSGEIRSDFDLRIDGRLNPRRVRATIGTGGPNLRVSTGSGRVQLRKAN